MQIKKFEAPTLQEALDNIKKELGPEAIILQTKKHKRGFGLMSQASVEVTAAVSDRSLHKKQFTENRVREDDREAIKSLPADRQAQIHDRYLERHLEKSRSARDSAQGGGKKLTATRYIDIDDSPKGTQSAGKGRGAQTPVSGANAPAGATSGGVASSYHQASGTSRSRLEQALGRGMAQTQAPDPAYGQAGSLVARMTEGSEELSHAGPSAPAGASAGRVGSSITLEEEILHLKRMIEEMKSVQDSAGDAGELAGPAGAQGAGPFFSPALQDAFDQLVVSGVERRFALALAKRASFELGEDRSHDPDAVLDQIAVEIMHGVSVESPLPAEPNLVPTEARAPTVLALVGPTGVGKTTTVAKMASEALLHRKLKVGLINLDSYKVAAFDQLGTYAKILNVPFRSAANADELKAALQDFRMLDVVLIDTAGRSQRDPDSLREMQAILQSVQGLRTQLVLSVTTRDTELYDMANRFNAFHPQGVIVSKLDEATTYGAVYNLCQKVKLPLLYFTTGQRVPEDIEEATTERVAALVLDL